MLAETNIIWFILVRCSSHVLLSRRNSGSSCVGSYSSHKGLSFSTHRTVGPCTGLCEPCRASDNKRATLFFVPAVARVVLCAAKCISVEWLLAEVLRKLDSVVSLVMFRSIVMVLLIAEHIRVQMQPLGLSHHARSCSKIFHKSQ